MRSHKINQSLLSGAIFVSVVFISYILVQYIYILSTTLYNKDQDKLLLSWKVTFVLQPIENKCRENYKCGWQKYNNNQFQ